MRTFFKTQFVKMCYILGYLFYTYPCMDVKIKSRN